MVQGWLLSSTSTHETQQTEPNDESIDLQTSKQHFRSRFSAVTVQALNVVDPSQILGNRGLGFGSRDRDLGSGAQS